MMVEEVFNNKVGILIDGEFVFKGDFTDKELYGKTNRIDRLLERYLKPKNKVLLVIDKNKIMKRYDIINHLIKKNNYKSYLEIGTQSRSNCFDKIECDFKYCVDPDPNAKADFVGTSDEFFEQNNHYKMPSKPLYDTIFIDGLHTEEQVYKDIINSLSLLSENGIIVCHDMLPIDEKSQRVPRETKVWMGNCWKAFVKLRALRSDLEMRTINTDCGCGLIKRGEQENLLPKIISSYEDFDKDRKNIMNIISSEEFLKLY